MAKKRSDPNEPLPGQLPLPLETNPFDALLDAGAPETPKPEEPTAQATTPEAPLINLGADAYADLVPPTGTFSDDPPPGWVEEPASSQDLDPVAAARASLLEDAARASGGDAPKPPAPTIPVPVERRGSRAPDIRAALARAATSNPSRYRSRITVGSAYQYDGKLHSAPPWIDRNWAAYEDGPAINVPDVGIVKKGQWIVAQDVLSDDGTVAFSEIKVYDDAVFRSLFMEDVEK